MAADETGMRAPAEDPRGLQPGEMGELRTHPLEGEIDRTTYTLGPGDRLALWLSGERVRVTMLDVTPEGVVLPDPAGPVPVSGLTVDESEEAIRRALAVFYHNVTIRVQLAEIRFFQIHVLGEVESPGAYTVSAVERAASAIEKAGGVSTIGSQRNIRIHHLSGKDARVDLVSYELLGGLENNPLVSAGDVVYVPPLEQTATVLGAVFRPGRIELRPGDTIGDLVSLAGGPTQRASLESVELERFEKDNPARSERLFLNLDGLNGVGSRDAHRVLKNGDRLFIRSIPKWHEEHTILVEGEVQYPGWYAIEGDEELLSEIIDRAGGFTPQAALGSATVVRAERDTVVDREFLRLKNMPVADMSKTEYEYFKFRSRERPGEMVADFEKLFVEGDPSHDLVLRNGDVITVPRKPRTVSVEGQVASPGHVIFSPGRGVDYYVTQAGGYSWNANRGKARVIKVRSGEWKWPKQVKSLEPGDTIWVPEKREINWWPLFMDVTRVLAQLATVYIVVDRALLE